MVEARAGELLPDEVLTRLAEQVRIKGGTVPRTVALDLRSPDGFLGAAVARRSPGWTVYATLLPPEDRPGNLETIGVSLPELPFDAEALGMVTGAYLHETMEGWSPELADEISRVLAPGGTLALLFRGPSPNNRNVRRGIPEHAVGALRHAGFDKVDEVKVSTLDDQSWVYRLAGTKPG